MTRSARPNRLRMLTVRDRSGADSSAGETVVKKGRWNWTENTVPWKELVHNIGGIPEQAQKLRRAGIHDLLSGLGVDLLADAAAAAPPAAPSPAASRSR